VEAIGLHLAGIDPHKAQVIQSFVKRGFGIGDLDKIEVVGVPMDRLEAKFKEARTKLEAEMAQTPEPWSASKAVNALVKSGYFRLPNKRTMQDIITALIEDDPRAKKRDKMIHSTVRRRFEKGKLQGEKTDSDWLYWTA